MSTENTTPQESIARITAPDHPLDDFDAHMAVGRLASDTVKRLADH